MADEQTHTSAGLWPWLWAIVIGLALIPNGIMLATALRSNTAAVEERAYEASKHYDARKEQYRAFAALGLELQAHNCGTACLELELSGPVADLEDISLRFVRPADAGLDRQTDWPDPGETLRIELPAPGHWRVELRAKRAGVALATSLPIYGA